MSEQPIQAVLLIGMPGVGKGTQGKLLGRIPGLFHLSTGEIFRALRDDTDDGRLVANCLSRGQLVPDALTIEIWTHWLNAQIQSQSFRPAEQLLLLDGIPRNLSQCQCLAPHLEVLQVIYLNPPIDEPIVQRLRQRALIEGRADDADESIIRNRFEVYRRETAPILQSYRRELIHEIDPMGSSAEVLKRILMVLMPVIAATRGVICESDDFTVSSHESQ